MSSYPRPDELNLIFNINNYFYNNTPLTIGEGNDLYYSKNGGNVNGDIRQTTKPSFIYQNQFTWGFTTLTDAAICSQSNGNVTWAMNRGSTSQFASINFFTGQSLSFRIGFMPTVPFIGASTTEFRILDVATNQGVELSPGSTAWSAVSDIRYKENVQDIEDGMLEKLLNLRTIKYSGMGEDAKEPTKLGIIAQELQEQGLGIVVNEASSLSVRYTELIPVLIKGIQELSVKVQELESKVNSS